MSNDNGQVKIDKNIPIPTERTNHKKKYPWLTMDVGDSFLVDSAKTNMRSSCMFASAQYAPRKFVARQSAEGTRVWRTE